MAKPKTKPKAKSVNVRNLMRTAVAAVSTEIENSMFTSAVLEDISGFYPSSLVMSLILGKINSGMYVISGPEQSSKSSLAASIAGSAIADGTTLVKHYDVERAVRASYLGKIIARESGIPWKQLAPKDKEHHEVYHWITETRMETLFDEMETFLKALPDKTYLEDEEAWFLVFDRKPIKLPKGVKPLPFADNLYKVVSSQLTKDVKRSGNGIEWYNIGDSPEFQAFYLIDSLKAMTLKVIEDGTKNNKMPAVFAKAMSEKLPYVKGLLRDKHAVLFCINQMYLDPLAYGDPLKETGGSAIKLYSDVRAIAKPIAIPEPFKRTKGDDFYVEPSVFEDGAFDRYTYKRFKNNKNKFSDFPGLTGMIRVWSTGPGVRPGICPVYDAAQFLELLGLASIGSTKKCQSGLRITLAKSKLLGEASGKELMWLTFKEEIFCELGYMEGENLGILDICRSLIHDGTASELLKSKGSSQGVDHLGSDDSDDSDE